MGKVIFDGGVRNVEVGELEFVGGVSGGVTDAKSGILICVGVEDVAEAMNAAGIVTGETSDTKLVELAGPKVEV